MLEDRNCAVQAPRESQLNTALQELEKSIISQTNIIHDLHNKLDPIMLPAIPEPKNGVETTDAISSEVVRCIKYQTNAMYSLNSSLISIIKRLEV